MPHTCHAAGCQKRVPEAMFMCRAHWFSLPKAMRDAIWATYRPGQEDDKSITPEYSRTAQECVRLIAKREGKSEGEIDIACRVYRMCETPAA